MAKKLEYQITTDASQGIQGVNKYAAAVKRAMKDVDSSTDDASTSAQKLAKVYADLADTLESELKGAAKAADALGAALGPEIANRTDLPAVVTQLHKLGLSFEEITADSDKLGASLRKLDSVTFSEPAQHLERMRDAAGGATRGADGLSQSARGANSALANMIGNSVQDMGQFAGVTGSAGVAIGQMAEYMSDATLESEGLAAALGSMAAVAGPIAVLAFATETMNAVMTALNEKGKTAAENQQAWVTAMTQGGDAAENFADHLRDADKVMADVGGNKGYRDVQKGWLGAVTQFGAVGIALDVAGKSFGAFGQKAEDVTKLLSEVGFNAGTWAKALGGGQAAIDKTADALHEAGVTGDDYDKVISALTQGQKDYNLATQRGAIITKFFGESSDDAAEAARKLREEQERSRREFDATADQLRAWADSITVSTSDAGEALTELGGTFKQMSLRSDALRSVLDVGDSGIETLDAVVDIHDAMRDLATFVGKDLKGKIPNIFDPNDIHAGPFLNKIQSLRGTIQQQIVDAFSTGGAPAATKTADNFVNELFTVLGGKVSKGDIEALLGIDDLEAKVKVALDQKTLNEAKEELAILTGLQGGVTPYTATIALALAKGTLSADAAKILIEQMFPKSGVEVPSSVATPSDASSRAAQAEAQRFIDNNKSTMTTEMPSKVGQPTNAIDAQARAQAEIDKLAPLFWPTIIGPLTPASGGGPKRFLDAGGTSGPYGGIAGERRPEIIDNRFLVTGPTYVPPGTRVTGGARTARILRTRGTRGLRRYDSGGVVAGAANVNINFNGVGSIGNRYDLMRSTAKAVRDSQRLRGTRG